MKNFKNIIALTAVIALILGLSACSDDAPEKVQIQKPVEKRVEVKSAKPKSRAEIQDEKAEKAATDFIEAVMRLDGPGIKKVARYNVDGIDKAIAAIKDGFVLIKEDFYEKLKYRKGYNILMFYSKDFDPVLVKRFKMTKYNKLWWVFEFKDKNSDKYKAVQIKIDGGFKAQPDFGSYEGTDRYEHQMVFEY